MLSAFSIAQSATIDSWNRDNVVTDLPPHVPGVTYDSKLFTNTTRAETDGAVIWKEGSVVSPGAQVLTDSPPGSNANCIITTGTNRADPNGALKTCQDPFQSAKRVKLEAREPGTGVIVPDPQGAILLQDGQPLDMVFSVNAADDLARTYRVFKKYINATGQRMDGFVVELGFGTGDDFAPSSDGDGLKFTPRQQGQNPNPIDFPIPTFSTPPGNSNLGSLMSAGLFGDSADIENRTIDGYFGLPADGLPWTDPSCDPDPSGTERSYYNLVVRSEDRIETVGDVQGLHYCLFGNMLPQGALPLGYFWDDDGDPDTDADTIADWDGSGLSPACGGNGVDVAGTPCWHTYVVLDTDDPTSPTYGEPVLDAAGNFTRPDPAPVPVPAEVLQFWVDNPDTGNGTTFFFITELDDMGLTNNNYHITVDLDPVNSTIATWPTYDADTGTATFTMRTSNVGEGVAFEAPWLATPPPQLEAPVAADLAVQPLDFSANVSSGDTVTLPVTVTNIAGGDPILGASGQVIGEARDASGKLYFSFLGDIIELAAGGQASFGFDWLVADPTGLPAEVTWTVTVVAEGGDPDPTNDTQTANVAISRADVALDALDVPQNAKTGRDYEASVTISNVGDLPASGTVTVTANGVEVLSSVPFSNLGAGSSVEVPFTWTAPDVSKKLNVQWTATVTSADDSNPDNDGITLQTKVTPGGRMR
jgi:hypothetical protein